MAIDWGSWRYSGSNGMRVGVNVSVEAVSHSEGGATFTVDYWTENQYTYGDSQQLNLTGSIGGSISFTNNDGGSPVKRGTRTYTYNYSDTSYGSSPGSRTFGCTLSGAYNGITPSTSHTTAIPARPYGVPAAPTAATATRVSDTQTTITWTRHSTSGAPYNSQTMQRFNYTDTPTWTALTSPSSTATTYSDTKVLANKKYAYRMRGNNGAGSSAWDQTNDIYTTPSAPPTCTRTDSGADQLITWTNTVGYIEYTTEIWHAVDGVWDSTPLAAVDSEVTSYLDVAPGAGEHTYKVRNLSDFGALYSGYSPDSDSTVVVAGPPSAPSGLSPDGVTMDPTLDIDFTWHHNPVDGSAQTKYTVRHREQGTSTWTTTTNIVSSISRYTLLADTYAKGQAVEWQVRTYGSDPGPSVYSGSAEWTCSPVDSIRYPVYLDMISGTLLADHAAPAPGGVGGGGESGAGYFTTLLGSGDTLTVTRTTHGLRASRGLIVQVQEAVTGAVVFTDVSVESNGDVTVTFSEAVAANDYRLTIVG